VPILPALRLAKAFKPSLALKGGFLASLGSSSHIGVSLMCSSSPKSTHKTATLRSSNFVSKGFFVGQGKSAVNPFGLTSILTKQQRKILASKSN